MTNFRGLVVNQEAITRIQIIINSVSTTSEDLNVIEFTDEDNFYVHSSPL